MGSKAPTPPEHVTAKPSPPPPPPPKRANTTVIVNNDRVTVATGQQRTVYRSLDDDSSASQIAILHTEIETLREERDRLTTIIRDVIRGDWCITDLQEAIGDV